MMKSVFKIKNRMSKLAYSAGLLSLVLAFALSLSAGGASAANLLQTAPSLGDAESFAVLAALSASSANTTTIWGDLGLHPGLESSKTGPWVVNGSEYYGPGTLAQDAQGDALAAFNNLAGQSSDGSWSLETNPAPGVWTAADSPTFSGTLTLSGDYDDVWIFQISESLTFSGDVVMEGDAQACNVFWQVASDATIAAGSNFVGTLIAGNDITIVSGATVSGRAISLNSSITVDNNTITFPPCEAAPVQEPTPTTEPTTGPTAQPTTGPTAVPATSTPEPETLPDTGGDFEGLESQTIRYSLGALGLTLVLFGFILSRRTQKTEG